VIAHGYDSLDNQIVWDAIHIHLPKLVGEVESLLNDSNTD
jgi:uncharacterized protein with HEPN domain